MVEKLKDDAELLFRQIHPDFVQDGDVSSAGFRPTQKDQGRLSVDRSSVFNPAQSFALYTEAKELLSQGTYGVTVEEFASSEVPCLADPIKATQNEPANPAHALADFSSHGTNKQKTISKKLARKANDRGRLHPL